MTDHSSTLVYFLIVVKVIKLSNGHSLCQDDQVDITGQKALS